MLRVERGTPSKKCFTSHSIGKMLLLLSAGMFLRLLKNTRNKQQANKTKNQPYHKCFPGHTRVKYLNTKRDRLSKNYCELIQCSYCAEYHSEKTGGGALFPKAGLYVKYICYMLIWIYLSWVHRTYLGFILGLC